MSTESSKLISKKKFIVNKESYFQAPRNPTDLTHFDGSFHEDVGDLRFFNTNGKDKLRVLLGKNWDFRQKENSY